MQPLMLITFLVIFLVEARFFPFTIRAVSLLPDVLSMVATVVVVLALGKNKTLHVSTKYVVFFLLFGLHLLNGAIINAVQPGAFAVGLRVYLKYIPFFFIPAVYEFSDQQIKHQLKFLLVLALLQLPVVLFQRFVQFKGILTGDVITGTLGGSGTLSLFLIGVIAMVFAFYLKKRISVGVFVVLLILLFLPTTLNETKATLVLLPMALFIPLFLLGKGSGTLTKIPMTAVILIALFGSFIGTYDAILGDRFGRSVTDMLKEREYWEKYLAGQSMGYDEKEKPGKIDRVVIPVETLSEDPITLLVGLGIGNVIEAPLQVFDGEYVEYLEKGSGGMAQLLWETGLLGATLSIAFLWMVFRDSLHISRQDGLGSAIGLGWIPVVAIVGVGLFYYNMIMDPTTGYLFWYFSGYLAAKGSKRLRF